MSTALVKIQNKGQVTIPSRLRQRAGIAEGDMLEATFRGGNIVLTPKLVIDRAAFPNADDEYTPAQRRWINTRLAKADLEIKKGRTHGPFDTADQMIAAIERELKKESRHEKENEAVEMKIDFAPRALVALEAASSQIRNTFYKQLKLFTANPRHPSLRTKKFDGGKNWWQARVNDDWRFYFTIVDGTYVIQDVIKHPK